VEQKFKPVYVCGLGLGVWFSDCGIERSRIIEMDWWEIKDVTVNVKSGSKSVISTQFVPVQHWSKRFLNDDQATLWGGFVVSKDGFKFFFNGDTGYNQVLYEEIGNRVGPIDLAAIPIGAYEPRDIMKVQHVDPGEAFLIHKHLRCKYSFGIHYGAFMLTDEPLLEPIEKITKIAKENPDVPLFEAIEHGVTVIMNKADKSVRQVK
jgi:N-acyl-phosphatidylethanolamine-hydrolysing phospholipase D